MNDDKLRVAINKGDQAISIRSLSRLVLESKMQKKIACEMFQFFPILDYFWVRSKVEGPEWWKWTVYPNVVLTAVIWSKVVVFRRTVHFHWKGHVTIHFHSFRPFTLNLTPIFDSNGFLRVIKPFSYVI